MQDLIFLNSNQFFDDNPDSLGFAGLMAAWTTPYLRARPNLGPMEQSTVRAEGEGLHNGGKTIIPLTLTSAHSSGLDIIAGRTYNLEGLIHKCDDGITTAFHLEGSRANREVCTGEVIDLGPLTIGGVGSIAKASVKFAGKNRKPLWELIVVHGPMVSTFNPGKCTEGSHALCFSKMDRTSSVRLRYLLSVDDLDVPLNTNFKIGSRIHLIGGLDSIGATTDLMVVNVSFAMALGLKLLADPDSGR
ncbi:hypothetical protein MJO29_016680 [Puccinia striiformis f. sp. tritici]|uniref:Uncharacterized protein n=1 Tax=Puccinia striiformis f. sp. tritici PST-78 TaxID=1165861 RepID=A0A0L0V5V1_9BASI|nr:hypothetical protein Pst134EB_001803 [Puccinia striiformis f. sp. tritici]KAI7933842.1 hypothetical protein MJO29_016680 [Puccinia striiformis f. sp. tritici]KAI9603526.1 hypothetical protein KEM48_000940 [Puccinia striiformis f. sp. tritici PST-130]KNE94680.1 hypothetical protein PSTG_11955 [Puccinia striiformis f. sp. tritici PST-78]